MCYNNHRLGTPTYKLEKTGNSIYKKENIDLQGRLMRADFNKPQTIMLLLV